MQQISSTGLGEVSGELRAFFTMKPRNFERSTTRRLKQTSVCFMSAYKTPKAASFRSQVTFMPPHLKTMPEEDPQPRFVLVTLIWIRRTKNFRTTFSFDENENFLAKRFALMGLKCDYTAFVRSYCRPYAREMPKYFNKPLHK